MSLSKKGALGLALLACLTGVAVAQSEWLPPAGGGPAPLMVPGLVNLSNRAVPVSSSNPFPVTGTVTAAPSGTQNVAVTNFPATQAVSTAPNRGVATASMATVGTTASALVPAGAARSHLMVQNQSTTAVLTCTFNGVAPVSGTTGIEIYPMGNVAASGMAGAFMPTGAVNCISNTAGTRVYVSYLQ